jgi:5'(3')-deoxyribonucleotidase
MDGVLCDFVTGALYMHCSAETHDDIVTWNFYEEWGITAKEFWGPLRGHEFWENLEPYPWAIDLYKELKQMGDVTICTSPNADEACIIGKYRWGQKYLGLKTNDFMVGSKKFLMANKQNTLIDDYIENVNKFRVAGGGALLFKQPWNSGYISYDWQGIIQTIGSQIIPL